jgi:hypothetical protein
MKQNKFRVEIFNDDNEKIKEKEYKSYTDIAQELDISYYDVRNIHLTTENKSTKKYIHNNLKELLKNIKIYSIKPVKKFINII